MRRSVVSIMGGTVAITEKWLHGKIHTVKINQIKSNHLS